MSQVTIQEVRKLILPLATIVEIAIDFDRAKGGSLWRAPIEKGEILSDGEAGLAVSVRAQEGAAPAQRKFDSKTLAAAIIRYCREARIPLPRQGAKTLEVVPQGLAFTIEVTMLLPARYETGATGDVTKAPAPST